MCKAGPIYNIITYYINAFTESLIIENYIIVIEKYEFIQEYGGICFQNYTVKITKHYVQ